MGGHEISFFGPIAIVSSWNFAKAGFTFLLHFVVTKRRNSHLDHAGGGGGADVRQEGNMTAPARKHWVRLRERMLQLLLLLLYCGKSPNLFLLFFTFVLSSSSIPYGISLTQAHIPVEVHEPKVCRKPQAFVLAFSKNTFNWVICKQTPNKDFFLLVCRSI